MDSRLMAIIKCKEVRKTQKRIGNKIMRNSKEI